MDFELEVGNLSEMLYADHYSLRSHCCFEPVWLIEVESTGEGAGEGPGLRGFSGDGADSEEPRRKLAGTEGDGEGELSACNCSDRDGDGDGGDGDGGESTEQ